MQNVSRSRTIIAAALVAAAMRLGGRAVEVRHGVEAPLIDILPDRVRRFFSHGVSSQREQGYPYRNGGQRRKNAMRARRMNNAGHGNRWSARHA